MIRGLIVLSCFCAIVLGGYLAFNTWAIRRESINLFDRSRGRAVSLEITVLRDAERRAAAGIVLLPVAIISHGNTVRHTEYSFLAKILAARGYLVVSIQNDLSAETPLVTEPGKLYQGGLPGYQRAEKNILFAINHLKTIQSHANYENLTMVGHCNGGDIAMYFAQQNPDLVKMVVMLDNLRFPCVTSGRVKILSFRSRDWAPDQGVVPSETQSIRAGITIVQTEARHVEMSDRGPGRIKDAIGSKLDQFLNGNGSTLPIAR